MATLSEKMFSQFWLKTLRQVIEIIYAIFCFSYVSQSGQNEEVIKFCQ